MSKEILSVLKYCAETGEFSRATGKKSVGFLDRDGYLLLNYKGCTI